MISPDLLMYGMGIFMFLGAVYFGLCLIFRKSIWNLPVIASMYIMFTLILTFFGIVFIKQINLSDGTIVLLGITMFIWGYITSKLPARKGEKEEKIETNKGT